jgi:hypothetical protein
MKHLSIETASVALLLAASIAMSGAAAAFDLNGAWAKLRQGVCPQGFSGHLH